MTAPLESMSGCEGMAVKHVFGMLAASGHQPSSFGPVPDFLVDCEALKASDWLVYGQQCMHSLQMYVCLSYSGRWPGVVRYMMLEQPHLCLRWTGS